MFDREEGGDKRTRSRPSYVSSSDQIFNVDPDNRYKNVMDFPAKYNASGMNG